jgi:hypothetical protein
MKFNVTYAFNCPCYGTVEIEAESVEEAAEIAKLKHNADNLIRGWDPAPEAGSEGYRVVSIDLDGEVLNDGFNLD